MMGDDGSYVNHFLELERTSMIFKSMSNGMFLVLRDTFRYPPLDQARWFASLCFPVPTGDFLLPSFIAIRDLTYFNTLSICCGREHIFPSRTFSRYSYPDWQNCTLEQCQWVPWAGEAWRHHHRCWWDFLTHTFCILLQFDINGHSRILNWRYLPYI